MPLSPDKNLKLVAEVPFEEYYVAVEGGEFEDFDGSAIYGGISEAHWTNPDTGDTHRESAKLVLPHRIRYLLGDKLKVTLEAAD